MSKNNNPQAQRLLVLLKLDAQRLFERIKSRSHEYLYEFSLKRSREHFAPIFYNRYEETGIKELLLCGEDVIVSLDQFYAKVEEMKWYLNVTQDMPSTVETKVLAKIREIEKLHTTLNLYLDVELGLVKEA